MKGSGATQVIEYVKARSQALTGIKAWPRRGIREEAASCAEHSGHSVISTPHDPLHSHSFPFPFRKTDTAN